MLSVLLRDKAVHIFWCGHSVSTFSPFTTLTNGRFILYWQGASCGASIL